jgi:subfamily B ATP-binding cassette protein HlyB/CyaB
MDGFSANRHFGGRLGDILNTRTEVPPTSTAQLPQLKGHITLDQVTFRYRPEAAPVLNGISLDVKAGEVIGIVGRSGSGKSTLTKLVQRLYTPEGGRLLVDGIDISLIDAAQLRRQVGVVLQENLLFNRSVRENIAITDPAAPIEAVMRVAQLAGAHEFISELPEGYNTLVGEQGGSLSGGQRQRVAIARALFTNPRILILDEATSALDYESEAIIQKNMAHICKGRTVLIIAHRLSASETPTASSSWTRARLWKVARMTHWCKNRVACTPTCGPCRMEGSRYDTALSQFPAHHPTTPTQPPGT